MLTSRVLEGPHAFLLPGDAETMEKSGVTANHTSREGEQDRLRTIIARMADGIVIVNADGKIEFANPAAEELFGRPASELIGRDLGFPVIAGDTAEVEVIRPHRRPVSAELRTVETDWNGAPAHLISLRDITDRKRAQEGRAQLEREKLARIEAEAANEAKSDFLALMSHELRTPLNAVIGYSELLELGIVGALAPDQLRHVARIRSSARHLLGLVNEVLDLARVEAGRLALQQGCARVDDTVDAAIALVQPLAESKQIELRATGKSMELSFQGDDDRVRQILVNLINNAVKFTGEGGKVHVEWTLHTTPPRDAHISGPGPWLCLSVIDTGAGIPPDKLATIFDPFVQVESGKTRAKDGSGLGLTISRRLARLMKGDLSVQSTPGGGSTFSLWLPDASTAANESARWQQESPELAARLLGLGDVGKLLIAELDHILDAFVTRLRAEQVTEGIERLRFAEVTDHLGTFVADLGVMLAAVEEGRGELSSVVTDSTPIQAAVAERHGIQRARLGWNVVGVEREWSLLREIMCETVQRHGRKIPEPARNEAFVMMERVTQQAAETSVRAFNRSVHEDETGPLVRDQKENHSAAREG